MIDEKEQRWAAATQAQRDGALKTCVRALEELRQAHRLLEAYFLDADSPEPPGWCPVDAIDLLEQAIAMLEPLPPRESPEMRERDRGPSSFQ
jgi:hypothetical protein